jgi:hypothetical protein
MPVLGTTTNQELAKVAKGSYRAMIAGFSEVKKGDYGPATQVTYALDRVMTSEGWEDMDAVVELAEWVSVGGIQGPSSKLHKLASAAFKRPLEEGEEIDTDDLENKYIIVTVDEEKKGDKMYSRIKGHLPWGKAKTATAPSSSANNKPVKRQAPALEDDEEDVPIAS